MFTWDQIKSAHAKVKSGADFPAYAREIKTMGVTRYDHFVSDGHTEYHGQGGYVVEGPTRYDYEEPAEVASPDELKTALVHHQQGGSDYPTFCRQAGRLGVEKWTVDLEKMTCTYYSKAGDAMLEEVVTDAAK